MGRKWSWSVLRYYPDICRDALRDKGKETQPIGSFFMVTVLKVLFLHPHGIYCEDCGGLTEDAHSSNISHTMLPPCFNQQVINTVPAGVNLPRQ